MRIRVREARTARSTDKSKEEGAKMPGGSSLRQQESRLKAVDWEMPGKKKAGHWGREGERTGGKISWGVFLKFNVLSDSESVGQGQGLHFSSFPRQGARTPSSHPPPLAPNVFLEVQVLLLFHHEIYEINNEGINFLGFPIHREMVSLYL